MGFLLQYQVAAAGFAQSPFVHLGDNLLYRRRHGPELPLSVAVNAVSAFKRDHIAIPVGAFPAGRRLCSPDRYDLVGFPIAEDSSVIHVHAQVIKPASSKLGSA